MTARLARIVRHPIKAAGWEEIGAAALETGRALPFDRVWAVATEGARLEGGWGPKQNFLRGVAAPALMAVRCRLDEASRRVTLAHPEAGEIAGRPDEPAEAAALVHWLRPLWPENRPAPAAILRAGDQPFSDVPSPFVAVLNLASNRALGARMGRELSIHRWRGNLWLDGLAPWEEFDLVGRTIRIGAAELSVEARITRCRATGANPETGRQDADTLGALAEGYGHEDMGVYATVTTGGRVAIGDEVVL
ncbi:MAG: MOSC domain-containing protein [Rhodobacteraceae bacterium]|nr:MOSC domain-containing protein [Paracoccaceae bacterium]